MFDSPILNLVILLSFTYFIGSLMVSAVVEVFAGVLQKRGKTLKAYLKNLFNDEVIFSQFIKSEYIASLMTTKGNFPSYIPAENFYMALMEIVGTHHLAVASQVHNGIQPHPLYIAIDTAQLPSNIKTVLKELVHKAQANTSVNQDNVVELFEKEVETFFDSAMDRLSGSYKRNSRFWQLIIGFIAAGLLNIDTIKITKDSFKDPVKLSKTVDNIAASIDKISQSGSTFIIVLENDSIVVTRTVLDSIAQVSDTTKPEASVQNAVQTVNKLKVFYGSMGSPLMGYSSWTQAKTEWFGTSRENSTTKPQVTSFGGLVTFIFKVLGILLTALALQLGANYWFDMLNRFVNVRAAGKKPNEDKAK